jgi:hypothetical protein
VRVSTAGVDSIFVFDCTNTGIRQYRLSHFSSFSSGHLQMGGASSEPVFSLTIVTGPSLETGNTLQLEVRLQPKGSNWLSIAEISFVA